MVMFFKLKGDLMNRKKRGTLEFFPNQYQQKITAVITVNMIKIYQKKHPDF